MPNAEAAPRISGIFSLRTQTTMGFGATKRKTIYRSLWHARELEDGQMLVQPLNGANKADGPQKVLDKEEFFKRYVLEPELSYKMVTKRLILGDAHLRQKQYDQAQSEYQGVLDIDTENIRANFGIGLAYLAAGEFEKCEYVLERLVSLNEAFKPEHKHLFNKFGISLRKHGLHDQALRYYGRALALAGSDENLYVNMARAAFEKGDAEAAFDFLRQALTASPEFRTAERFAMYLLRQGLRPKKDQFDFFRHCFPQGGRVYLSATRP